MCDSINLIEVDPPLIVSSLSELNDYLNGTEKVLSFIPKYDNKVIEVVQSLAKWKRWTLSTLKFTPGNGIITDMRAIRMDEEVSNIHSICPFQYDWEKVIKKEDRNLPFLFNTAGQVYSCMREMEEFVLCRYPQLSEEDGCVLKKELHFVSTQELENMYPNLTPKEREHKASKLWGSIFIYKIGSKLQSGQKHDGRAPDYDDWSLNGDILVWYEPLGQSVELSSMGIRVDKNSIVSQCKESEVEHKLKMPYHKAVLDETLPYTIGGGIGQSRLAMILLRKMHIGEVQYSQWPDKYREELKSKGIELL